MQSYRRLCADYREWPYAPLSGPVSCDTARPSQRYPPIARYGVLGVSTWPGEHAKWRCDTPPQKGYLSDTCSIPYENKETRAIPPSAILSRKGMARYGVVSRTGPLRCPHMSAPIQTFPKVDCFSMLFLCAGLGSVCRMHSSDIGIVEAAR